MRSNCLIRHIIALALEVNGRNRILFLQRLLSAFRANCECVIGEVLKYLGLLQAIIAVVDVNGHFILPSCKR